MACPKCGNMDAEKLDSDAYTHGDHPNVQFESMMIFCKDCDMSFNCIGTKKI